MVATPTPLSAALLRLKSAAGVRVKAFDESKVSRDAGKFASKPGAAAGKKPAKAPAVKPADAQKAKVAASKAKLLTAQKARTQARTAHAAAGRKAATAQKQLDTHAAKVNKLADDVKGLKAGSKDKTLAPKDRDTAARLLGKAQTAHAVARLTHASAKLKHHVAMMGERAAGRAHASAAKKHEAALAVHAKVAPAKKVTGKPMPKPVTEKPAETAPAAAATMPEPAPAVASKPEPKPAGFPPDGQVRKPLSAERRVAIMDRHEHDLDAHPKVERETVKEYTSGTHRRINSDLREGKEPPEAAAIRSAIDRAPVLAKPVVVHRGINFHDPKKAQAFMEHAEQAMKTGGVLEHKGFVSTTHDPLTASRGFSDPLSGVVMEIAARKGLNLSGGANSYSPTEVEMLLQEGSKFRVRGIKDHKFERHSGMVDHRRVIQLEQIV